MVEEETKAEAFSRLATARTRKALKMIDLLGNLASAQYESTPEQVDKIANALGAKLAEVIRKLKKEKEDAEEAFEL